MNTGRSTVAGLRRLVLRGATHTRAPSHPTAGMATAADAVPSWHDSLVFGAAGGRAYVPYFATTPHRPGGGGGEPGQAVLEVHPLTRSIGAEVVLRPEYAHCMSNAAGASFRAEAEAQVLLHDALYGALLAHHVLFIRGLEGLGHAAHLALAESFGAPGARNPIYPHADGYVALGGARPSAVVRT